MLSGQHQEQMLEIVLRKDYGGPVGRETTIEQGLADASRRGQNLRVG